MNANAAAYLRMAAVISFVGGLLVAQSSRFVGQENKPRREYWEQTRRDHRRLRDSLRRLAVEILNPEVTVEGSATPGGLVTFTLCQNSRCSQMDRSMVIAEEDALVVAFLLSFNSGSSELHPGSEDVVELTFREVLDGVGLFRQYGTRPIRSIEVIGHADLEEIADEALIECRLCGTPAVPARSNECLAICRAMRVHEILDSVCVVRTPSVPLAKPLFNADPFLMDIEHRFPGFLAKIGALDQFEWSAQQLGIPRNYYRSHLRVRDVYQVETSVASREIWREKFAKFRGVVVVIQYA